MTRRIFICVGVAWIVSTALSLAAVFTLGIDALGAFAIGLGLGVACQLAAAVVIWR